MSKPALDSPYRIALVCGRAIRLATYHQLPTYAGLLCGYPTADINVRCVQATLEQATRIMGADLEPVLLAAEACAYPDYPANPAHRHSLCEVLPPVATIALFESAPAARGDGSHSVALLVWFQGTWGLPEPAVVDAIRAIDWDRDARDAME